MRRFAFAARRLAQTVPLLAVVLFVVFVIVRLVPGDPARALLGLHATPQRIAYLNRTLGVDKPLLPGYIAYVGRVIHGDLGTSVRQATPVTHIIGQRTEVTLWLLGLTLLMSLAITMVFGTLAALRRDAPADHAVRSASVLGLSLPTFWLGLMLVSYIALPSGWFPVTGFGDGFAEHLHAMVLPAVTLTVAIAPAQVRALRHSLIGVLSCEYIAAARALGLSARRVLWRHAMPNAILPVMTVLAVQVGVLLFGEVVVENTFALPGIGKALLQAVTERDYPVIQGITLTAAVLVIGLGLLLDVIYVALDPRVKL